MDFPKAAERIVMAWMKGRAKAMPLTLGTLLLLAAGAADLAVSGRYDDGTSSFEASLDSDGPVFEVVQALLALAGLGLISLGGWRWRKDYLDDRRRRERRLTVVIEQRGLAASLDTPLINFVRGKCDVQLRSTLIDTTPFATASGVVDPSAALRETARIRQACEAVASDAAREDVTFLYGGIAPVPLTFLAGVLMGSEGRVMLVDWDRQAGSWRTLNTSDDGERFEILGMELLSPPVREVGLAVETSAYGLDETGFAAAFPGMPVIRLRLPTLGLNTHWSETKQAALADTFVSVSADLGRRGVATIHATLVAQNSLVFRCGRVYSVRNLPELRVYQYERSSTQVFPWGIRMPTHSNAAPSLV